MIFANIAGEQGPAFIERAAKNQIATDAGLRAAGRLFSQIFSFNVVFHP